MIKDIKEMIEEAIRGTKLNIISLEEQLKPDISLSDRQWNYKIQEYFTKKSAVDQWLIFQDRLQKLLNEIEEEGGGEDGKGNHNI